MSTAAKLPAGVIAGFLAATSLLLAACSATSQTVTETCDQPASGGAWNRLDKCVLESQVRSQLSTEVGRQVPPISCPDEIDADLGATTTCTFTGAEGTFNVTVTVTDVKWGDMTLEDGTPGNFVSGNAEFDITVADKPNP
ncbi:Domain of unknown function DUF4333 [Mycobacteriaceae bacterium]|jgi:hypothetical protein